MVLFRISRPGFFSHSIRAAKTGEGTYGYFDFPFRRSGGLRNRTRFWVHCEDVVVGYQRIMAFGRSVHDQVVFPGKKRCRGRDSSRSRVWKGFRFGLVSRSHMGLNSKTAMIDHRGKGDQGGGRILSLQWFPFHQKTW